MAENNFEKLLGKNGELVEERKKQVVMGAAQIIKSHCDNIGGDCVDKPNVCPFQRPGANFEIFKIYCCGLYDCHPSEWEL
ncbi:hypothetical protein [Selenomonas ruminantium]|uniref:hypothetical protein n=1 Tax=Selenomonas ruminantium TaxID=971 RepID=UPI0026EF7CD3|nr:hypothetical protein [Selenomonas ruminantium]